jgi:hypothetical protein
MKFSVQIRLDPVPEQRERLMALQREFARACNALVPIVLATRTWNRVALHHLGYRKLREAFPDIGSQMACNAIYSVSRTCRLVFQSPNSPFHQTLLLGKPLPRLRFLETAPVYFDRHTLSLKAGQASMYTLDGRMRFQLALQPEIERAFHERKLLEIALLRRAEAFELRFVLGAVDGQRPASPEEHGSLPQEPPPAKALGGHSEAPVVSAANDPAAHLPDYLFVENPAS